MRESTEAKARRYLCEGRLILTLVAADVVSARCRGSGEVYRCGHDPARGWHCDCPARRTCCHLVALQLVTVRRRDPEDQR
jgi:hypothetical protein